MNVFIKWLMCINVWLLGSYATAQTDTLYLSTAQAEELFIKQNLLLIAEKLSIDAADASILQAKLWPNPTLSVQDVNFWNAESNQFTVGLEQVILTGGKRRKLVEMERVSRDMSVQYFEELLRSFKVELRNACAELLYLQAYSKALEKQGVQLESLVGNHRNQAAQGNVSPSQLLRLQASLLEIRSEINDLQREMNQQQKDLNVLLNLPLPSFIVLTTSDLHPKSPDEFPYGKLIELAETSRPDLKEAMFQKTYFEKSLRYEKSLRTPDLTLNAGYDRAGGIIPHYVGVGVSVNLPLFDRNQGNIRTAKIGVQQSQTLLEQKQLEVRNEVVHAMQNYGLAYHFYRQITTEFIANLDEMQENYFRNFINKNIGIVEFLDFFEAWKENKRTALSAEKDIKISFEELQYAVGTEL